MINENVIVCKYAGDELASFGSVLECLNMNKFDIIRVFKNPHESDHNIACYDRTLIKEYSISKIIELDLEYDQANISLNAIIQEISKVGNYESVYSYTPQSIDVTHQLVAAAVGKCFDRVYIKNTSGVSDIVCNADATKYTRRISLINTYLSESLRTNLINSNYISSVLSLKKFEGDSLFRFFIGCKDWGISKYIYSSPWEFKNSKYERNRFEAELKVLKELKWESLIEIGSCEGYFTNLLLESFPDRKIVASEPDRFFYQTLSMTFKDRADTLNVNCNNVSVEGFDIVFISNVLYYCDSFPINIINQRPKYIVVSHDKTFHEEVVDRILISSSYYCIKQNDTNACIEEMEDFQVTKYGVNIKVWKSS